MVRSLLVALLAAGCSRRDPPPGPVPQEAPSTAGPAPERPVVRLEGPVRRGPYVQACTTRRARVCFETFEEVEGAVQAGDRVVAGPRGRSHGLELDGLTPGTEYAYTIRPGGLEGRFRTAPEGDAEVRFIVWGDSRTHADRVAKIAALAAAERADFSVHSGDLVDDGDLEQDWDLFFTAARPLLASGAFWPCMGNHEPLSKIYLGLFQLPEPERWYTFTWGPAQFFVLDSNYGSRDDAAQNAWLERELAASKARFRFAVLHYPVVSGSYAGFGFGEGDRDLDAWGRLFERHRVTAVLQGHNHNYQRHERNGIVYLTSGGAGAPLYSLGEGSPERKAAFKVNHYVRVRLKDRTCAIEAVDIDGNVIDRRSIEVP
jgi:predicted phosphodiesterase